MFKDRIEAGNLLAEQLLSYSNNTNVVVVAVPRGGLPIGFVIAKKLNVPLEIVLSKKIGHPLNKEFAIGAVTLKNCVLSDDVAGISKLYIDEETEKIRKLLKERELAYYGKRTPVNLKNKIVIVVDDGIATGNTLISSIQLIHLQKPNQIIVAAPVASKSAFNKIEKNPLVYKIICLLNPERFQAVGQFYQDFGQVSDSEAIKLLHNAHIKTK